MTQDVKKDAASKMIAPLNCESVPLTEHTKGSSRVW